MDVSDWKFAQQFNDLYERALQLSKEFKNDWGDDPASAILAPNGQPFASEGKDDSCDGSALIQWTGNTESLDWLCDSSKKPSQDVINIHRSKTDEEFVCWLMLPKDSSGEQWYFGRVFSRKRPSMPNHVRAFQDIAADAGNLLRRDSQFRDYLSPCLGHTKFVGRFERLQDCLDASYWCALLFTRPDCLKPWEFPFVKDDIAVVTIDNPFKLTADAISYWQLAEPNPLSTQFPVARPHKWPEAVTAAAKPQRPPERPRGVSLLDAAKAVSEGDDVAAQETRKRWHGDEALPRPIGKDVNHSPTDLYDPAALAEFVVSKGENGNRDRKALKNELSRIRRSCL